MQLKNDESEMVRGPESVVSSAHLYSYLGNWFALALADTVCAFYEEALSKAPSTLKLCRLHSCKPIIELQRDQGNQKPLRTRPVTPRERRMTNAAVLRAGDKGGDWKMQSFSTRSPFAGVVISRMFCEKENWLHDIRFRCR